MNHKDGLKKKVIRAASKAFIQRGIKGVRMDDIASSIAMSKRTIYELFKDKESLLVECIIEDQRRMDIYMHRVVQQTDNVIEIILLAFKRRMKQLLKVNKLFFEDLCKYPKVYRMVKDYNKEYREESIRFFKAGIEQGLLRSDINFDIMDLLIREQLDVLTNTNIYRGYSFAEVYEAIIFTYIRGISTLKGLTLLDELIEQYKDESSRKEIK